MFMYCHAISQKNACFYMCCISPFFKPVYIYILGNFRVDNILKTLLGNANLSGALLACFLDNTIPGRYF